jgi:hypothetical protein
MTEEVSRTMRKGCSTGCQGESRDPVTAGSATKPLRFPELWGGDWFGARRVVRKQRRGGSQTRVRNLPQIKRFAVCQPFKRLKSKGTPPPGACEAGTFQGGLAQFSLSAQTLCGKITFSGRAT